MMKVYGAVLVATCSIVSSGAADVLEGPEFIDVLLPEVAHVFGVTSAHHTTLEEMNLYALCLTQTSSSIAIVLISLGVSKMCTSYLKHLNLKIASQHWLACQ